MRLANIKLAGFKSFVDPTTIGTPGQLVGIVGPNGCGKSNVIDAVRWVLGESKASALRGESMQDVIFNGAGERKPVGRASVELHFNNDLGRIGGQWGQYTEISIKRVLSRDGDSSYYINNIPVRRRDIHDLFLGTGLGPRAYAIIEQGMISRVIEAKPEELRVFLEEAAGVSKYKERRKETESRIKDTRENLSRVEDIRFELSQQLEKLERQARVATEYRDHEARLKQVQHLLWFSKQQDALRARERHTAEVANLVNALEGIQAEVRSVEAKLEHMRSDHYTANDVLHQAQGGFYAANAEVTRLEQQLAFARENEARLTQQVAQITDQAAGLAHQEQSLAADRAAAEQALGECLAAKRHMTLEEQQAASALPALDEAVRAAAAIATALQQQTSLAEQSIRVLETKRDNLQRALTRLGERRERLQVELSGLSAPATEEIASVDAQFMQEQEDLVSNQASLDALHDKVQELQQTRRDVGEAAQNAARTLADLEARAHALTALQRKIGKGRDSGQWLDQHGLTEAHRLFSALDVDPDWNDALEAVLRESMEAIELARMADAIQWLDDGERLPGRVAVYSSEGNSASERNSGAVAPEASTDALLSKVRTKRPEIARLLADCLRGVRCAADMRDAVARREELGIGEAFVTPQGHLVSAQAINFFAPDNELHGVLARQRELVELDQSLVGARSAAAQARAHQAQVDADLDGRQQDYHAQGVGVSSQQRRCHDLDIARMKLRQIAEAAEHRRMQIAQELADHATQEGIEQQQSALLATEIQAAEAKARDQRVRGEAAHHARNEVDVALARGRERLRLAERAAQEAAFAERSCRDRLAELERRRDALSIQIAQQQQLLAQLEAERAGIDWAPIEQDLQQQLATRAAAEQALGQARDTLEGVGAQLRTVEEARLVAEQRLDPARTKIEEMRLKEQAALMLERQFTEQLTETKAELAGLPDALKAFGSKSGLPVEIERVQTAIAQLGAVNLAALTELSIAQERKQYLDAQSSDLTEAMATLEHAIRQIDRESRQLLQQTFDTVNENFSRLFPALFGGGEAQLVLTGEEILDSGVQVVAQPPGKRNTSIHLLSGGEKALTAISLVFALFQINPAPFCLLDEVDAPLDDPNTDRFCKMVQQMSAVTQFLFISHNKITMEMASQLVGITMPEPGISRVVAVDIEEALELAETGVA